MTKSEWNGHTRWILLALLLLCAGAAAAADQGAKATVEGSRQAVRIRRQEGQLLLNVADLAAALEQEWKVVSGGRLLTFCRTGEDALCIPVPLRDAVSWGKGDSLFVEASPLARALRLEIDARKSDIVIRPRSGNRDKKYEVSAFNADWGAGRGFRSGQTLPDIPLMDMDGREVRFSHFLGKRYIIYCWASW